MAAGVEHIHSNNWVHRDIKPDNILICAIDGWVRLKISDFGLSKKSEGGVYSITSGVVGTHVYLAPELLNSVDNEEVQVNDNKMTDTSDVFALGCVFYQFLTKEHPFGKKLEIVSNILRGNFNLRGVLSCHFFLNAFINCL